MPYNPRTRTEAHDISELCRRIALAMTIRDLSQSEVARRIGCRQSIVSDWLQKDRAPSGIYLTKLPAALDVDGHWLLTGEGEMDLSLSGTGVEMPASYARGGLAAIARVESALMEVRAELLLKDDAIQRAQHSARVAQGVRGRSQPAKPAARSGVRKRGG